MRERFELSSDSFMDNRAGLACYQAQYWRSAFWMLGRQWQRLAWQAAALQLCTSIAARADAALGNLRGNPCKKHLPPSTHSEKGFT